MRRRRAVRRLPAVRRRCVVVVATFLRCGFFPQPFLFLVWHHLFQFSFDVFVMFLFDVFNPKVD